MAHTHTYIYKKTNLIYGGYICTQHTSPPYCLLMSHKLSVYRMGYDIKLFTQIVCTYFVEAEMIMAQRQCANILTDNNIVHG